MTNDLDTITHVPAAIARSWLLHPATLLGSRAVPRDSDVLVLDLEDAVAATDKPAARDAVVAELDSTRAWVRINDAATPHWQHDLGALSGHPGLAGVMLAKAESADDVARTAALLPPGTPIVPMIESAAALLQVEHIARHPSTFRIAFGLGDFMRDTGISADPIALAYVRSRIVIASIAAGLPGPIDGPAKGNRDAIEASLAHSKAMGLTGALVLDSSSLMEVKRAFSPSEAELDWARTTVLADADADASGSRAGTPRDGSYAPALARARKLLALHGQLAGAASVS